jgi:hypothetical protein
MMDEAGEMLNFQNCKPFELLNAAGGSNVAEHYMCDTAKKDRDVNFTMSRVIGTPSEAVAIHGNQQALTYPRNLHELANDPRAINEFKVRPEDLSMKRKGKRQANLGK